ncbi:Intradiol ring-cleavage dioxygenase [Mycena venus]|uniref:Intradiol ring-cleavage dioxygenase n=1 Tax=Mycena venus TaxID=2733690 RepID=A0A8H6XPB4_9AGAR|nr:Intradiol ring-cleavage dioxygenase [Mycena venus]
MSENAEESIRKANKLAAEHGIDLSKLPKNLDMSPENITENVHAMNSNCPDERMKFVFKSLVTHLHDFVRETSITTEEWMYVFLSCGHSDIHRRGYRHIGPHSNSSLRPAKCVRRLVKASKPISTFPILNLILFLQSRIYPPLGFAWRLEPCRFAEPREAPLVLQKPPSLDLFSPLTLWIVIENGESIASEGKGDYLWVEGKVKDTKGNPIPNCIINTWETDGHGMYDNQYAERGGPDCRGRLHTREDGSFFFRAIVPVSYPIPSDGPVGKMVTALGRHVFRPAHLHMMLEAPGFEKLVTAFYFKGDPYLTSDAVFGVKSSLIVDTTTETDVEVTRKRGFKEATSHKVLKHDFVLATPEEGAEARKRIMPNTV